MIDQQAPTIDQILAMDSGELHEWSRGGHTVVTPFGLGTVYNETFLDDQLDGLCVFLEDRSQAFYSREHGWETRDDYVTREEQERAAQRSRRRSRARWQVNRGPPAFMKRIWERTAEGEMNVARAMQADADDLLEKFLAAGTSYPINPSPK
jgi:hypothetical protein